MSDIDELCSQSTNNESLTHDRHSQLILEENELFSEDEEEEAPDPSNDVSWNLQFRANAEEFEADTHQINSALSFSQESTPYNILKTLLTQDMLQKICEESELYAQQKGIPKFRPFDVSELWRFVAINLAMGIVKLPAIKDYWKQTSLFKTSFFSGAMGRDRFIQILRSIHFTNNEDISTTETDRFVKLGTFMDELVKNFKSLVHSGEYLCLDESMVPFKGRLSIKQYNPKKRCRFGVKLFVLADCASKVVLDVIPYQGQHTKMKYKHLVKELGFGGATVVSMLEPYFGKGHRVIVDNWFNSPKLARILKSKKTYVLGTVQKKRKGMPTGDRVTKKMKKGQIETFSDGDILVERWCDRRDVFMLNSFLGHSMIDSESNNPRNSRPKPGSVLLYNAKMGAVDDADKVMKPYKSIRKAYKWYRKVAFHLIDLAVYNSFLMFKQLNEKKMKYKDFLEKLITEIMELNPKPSTGKGRSSNVIRDEDRLTGQHFPQLALNNNGKKSRSKCSYCWQVMNKRKMTYYTCGQCKRRLCIGTVEKESCFTLYHTQTKLKKIMQAEPENLEQEEDTDPTPSQLEEFSPSESLLRNINCQMIF